ncbi:MAG: lysophospholipid acyltransferase family protein [Mycobacterium sp.]|nr:lysophospholipid acyltransferase family protein [Mycobacterium sp.]
MTNQHVLQESTDEPVRVRRLRRFLGAASDAAEPVLDVLRPFVDGTANLPRDGRFLLVGNHTQGAMEVILISHYVRRTIGARVRPLADRGMGKMRGLMRDVNTAVGAVVGSPESIQDLMRCNETILVFPGGGREIAKFKGEESTINWKGRSGFAREAILGGYPIVPVALVGSDEMYEHLLSRNSTLGQLSLVLSEKISGRKEMPMPLVHGIGPTLIPRPQRMYLRFGTPISTTRPPRRSAVEWVDAVKQTTQTSLEDMIADLLTIRADDPYRALNPLAWNRAACPAAQSKPTGASAEQHAD